MSENWATLPRNPLYQVSDHGEVKSPAGAILAKRLDRDGYYMHTIRRPGVRAEGERPWTVKSHLLVLEAFVGPRPGPGYDGCHDDGTRDNNHISNLRWDTKSANAQDRIKHGRDYQLNKTHCPRNHELADWNNKAQHLAMGRRTCLVCGRARSYFSKRLRRHGEPWTEEELQVLSDLKYQQLRRDRDQEA